MEEFQERQGMMRFVVAGNEAQVISGFIEDIRDATLEYLVSFYGLPMFRVGLNVTQVSLQMFLHTQNNMQIVSSEFELLLLPPSHQGVHYRP